MVSVDVIPGTKQEFIEFLKQQKCILSLDWVTGKYSAVVKGVFADIEALNQFNNSLSERFGSSVVQVILHTDLERTSLRIDDII
jgi:Lrp/AsnC family leucine-responsive transcriptional regulator